MDPLEANEIVRAVLGDSAQTVVDAAEARKQAVGGEELEEGAEAAQAAEDQPPAEEEYGGERSVFVGLSGGLVTQAGDHKWTLLYLDLALTNWLLVEPDTIIHHMQVQDRLSPSVKWDVIWVKAMAPVGRGSGPVSDAQFLTGEFVRARDFPSTPIGGTFGPDVGVFQAGTSPNCCTRKSR